MIKINGFDERMQYGGQDCEFGSRLKNLGLKTKQIRYSAICVHLDHSKSYENSASWEKNYNIRKSSIKNKIIETPAGIKEAGLNYKWEFQIIAYIFIGNKIKLYIKNII